MSHQNLAEGVPINRTKAREEDSNANHEKITVDTLVDQDQGLQDVLDLHQNTTTTGKYIKCSTFSNIQINARLI